MPEENPSNWKTVTAIATIAVSLFGNIVQCGTLLSKRAEIKQKDTELAQAQSKIDAANAAADRRREAVATKLRSYQTRMAEIDSQLKEAAEDNSRAQGVMAFGKPEDRAYAHSLFNDSIDRHNKLQKEKAELQDKIDTFQLNNISE